MAATLTNTQQDGDENLETYSLIWLDDSVNSSQENLQAQHHLRTSINHLLVFKDHHLCLQYIQSLPKDDRIVLIISGRFGRNNVPKISQFQQIISIYIYCMDKEANKQWSQAFSQVRGVFDRLDELIHQIQSDQNEREIRRLEESLSIQICNSNVHGEGQSSTELNGQFIHSQLLIDCLIRMKISSNDKHELISLCEQQYKNNQTELNTVKEFESNYSSNRSIWWYTRDSFIYRMLNKALRVQNIDLLFLFRFFIRDLGQELQKNKCSSPIRVYRAQLT